MKKSVFFLFVIGALWSLWGCGQMNHSQASPGGSGVSSSAESSEGSSEYEKLNVYQIIDNEDIFCKTISENGIDEKYNAAFDAASTTNDMMDIQKKYIDIWKGELEYSIGNYTKMLDQGDIILFNSSQKQWEDSTQNNLKLEKNILSDASNYKVTLGSMFEVQWLSEVRESYRQRTFRIKYLNYLLETQVSDPKPLKECLSLKFENE